MVIIETERLFLREMTKNDFEALYKVLADSDIMQHYPYTFDENRVKGWINRNIERYQISQIGYYTRIKVRLIIRRRQSYGMKG